MRHEPRRRGFCLSRQGSRPRSSALTIANLLVSVNPPLGTGHSRSTPARLSAPALIRLSMPLSSALRFRAGARLLLTLMFAIVLLTATGCAVHKTVEVPKPLTPLADASAPQLVAEVNRLATARSIHGKVDIQFEDTSFATSGIAEKYRTADGTITLQRPGKIYLVIQVPLLASDVAQMTSDGEHFRIAILKGDERYRRFVSGTNSAVYGKLEPDGTADS